MKQTIPRPPSSGSRERWNLVFALAPVCARDSEFGNRNQLSSKPWLERISSLLNITGSVRIYFSRLFVMIFCSRCRSLCLNRRSRVMFWDSLSSLRTRVCCVLCAMAHWRALRNVPSEEFFYSLPDSFLYFNWAFDVPLRIVLQTEIILIFWNFSARLRSFLTCVCEGCSVRRVFYFFYMRMFIERVAPWKYQSLSFSSHVNNKPRVFLSHCHFSSV